MALMRIGGGTGQTAVVRRPTPQSGRNNDYIRGAPSYAQPSNTRPSPSRNFLPVQGTISNPYGKRNSGYAAGYHTGLDIAARTGAPIRSAGSGVVIHAGWYGSYGYTVKVRHSDGSVGLYAHMSRVGVKVGQRIDFGMYLGAVGSSGNSTGPHLHWEVRKPGDRYGQQYDPRDWVRRATPSSGSGGRSYSGGPLTLGQIKGVAMKAGFSAEAASLMAAIAMAESSGRPDAHNPNASTGDNSYGLWQINMLGAMGPERRRWFGIGSNNALFDPLTNAKAAYKIYQSQGLRAWSVYSSGRYRQYLDKARRAKPANLPRGGANGSGGIDMGYLEDLATRSRSAGEIAGDLGDGYSVAFFKSDPELWRLLQRAAREGWDDSKLMAEIRGSRWWKRYSESERAAIMQRTTDPASYRQNMTQQIDNIKRTVANLGADMTDEQVKKLARMAYHGNWTDGQITTFIVNKSGIQAVLAKSQDVGGSAGEMQEAFTQWVDQYGVKMNDKAIARWVTKVLKGEATPGDFQAVLTKQAKSLYPHLADQIDQGLTLDDVAQPFRQTASMMLERSPEMIGLDDRLLRRALRGDGKQLMSLTDFEEEVRRSGDWQTTDNARAAYDTFGRQVLQDLGFAY